MNSKSLTYQGLKNKNIYNQEGDHIGEIHDVYMDIQTGDIALVSLGIGGFLGIGEKYVSVPLESLRYDEKNNHYVVDVDKDKLKNAPTVEKADWPERRLDQDYIKDVHQYYGKVPYFEKY